jgi:hypothetical protein
MERKPPSKQLLIQVRGPRVSLETYSYTGKLLDHAELV